MLLGLSGVEIERDVLAFLIERRVGHDRQALRQGGLAFKTMRELARRKHRFGVRPCRFAESGIERQTWRAGLRSVLIRKIEKLLFGLGIVFAKGNVGRSCRAANIASACARAALLRPASSVRRGAPACARS